MKELAYLALLLSVAATICGLLIKALSTLYQPRVLVAQ